MACCHSRVSTPGLTRKLAKPIRPSGVAVSAVHSQVGAFDPRKIDQMVGNVLPCGDCCKLKIAGADDACLSITIDSSAERGRQNAPTTRKASITKPGVRTKVLINFIGIHLFCF
jgi:hypothetical protein